ncbi:MAG: glycosyltransferase [Caldiserica bacterium]|jgi:UDP-D-galactose:(glucosyl)LPS alpha-1,6-D-galactosyltransferase|nr:glycosyltransferase [Caldisericota bacterium]
MISVALYSNFPFSHKAGTEKVIQIFCKWLLENGNSPRIVLFLNDKEITTPACDWLKEIKIERFRYPFSKLVRLRRFLRVSVGLPPENLTKFILADWEKNGVPDFAIALSFPEILPALKMALKKCSQKCVVLNWDHTSILHYFYQAKRENNLFRRLYALLLLPILRRSLPFADLHLAISNDIKNLILKFEPEARIAVIYNPVNLKTSKLIQRSKNPIFLFVGRIDDEHKNLAFMLKGFSLLKDRAWKLKIIGEGKDEKSLKEYAISLSIEKNIEWAGYKENPFEEIEECTALLLTSRFEGFGLVLVEANVHGIPVISSNCLGGPKDIVIEGVNGYLYPEGNMVSFVKILNLAQNGKLSFACPEEIRETALKFSVENYLSKLQQIFQEKFSYFK